MLSRSVYHTILIKNQAKNSTYLHYYKYCSKTTKQIESHLINFSLQKTVSSTIKTVVVEKYKLEIIQR